MWVNSGRSAGRARLAPCRPWACEKWAVAEWLNSSNKGILHAREGRATTSVLQGRNLGLERASSLLWVTQLFGDGSRRKGVFPFF